MATLILQVSEHDVSDFDYGLSEEGETSVSFWQIQDNSFFGLTTGVYTWFLRYHGSSGIVLQDTVNISESLPEPYTDTITGPTTITQTEHNKTKVSNVIIRDQVSGWTGGSYKIANNEDVFIDVPAGTVYEIRIS